MVSGLKINVSDLLPREYVGDEIKAIMPHSLIAWFDRLLGRKTWPVCFVRGKPIEELRAWMINGEIFMPPEMFSQLPERPRSSLASSLGFYS